MTSLLALGAGLVLICVAFAAMSVDTLPPALLFLVLAVLGLPEAMRMSAGSTRGRLAYALGCVSGSACALLLTVYLWTRTGETSQPAIVLLLYVFALFTALAAIALLLLAAARPVSQSRR